MKGILNRFFAVFFIPVIRFILLLSRVIIGVPYWILTGNDIETYIDVYDKKLASYYYDII